MVKIALACFTEKNAKAFGVKNGKQSLMVKVVWNAVNHGMLSIVLLKGTTLFSQVSSKAMILVDWFDARACKGTELMEGWYWHEDDGEGVGGPYASQEEAMEKGIKGEGWTGLS